jgi:hypothetical protein
MSGGKASMQDNELTLKDVWEKLVKIEVMLNELKDSSVVAGDIISMDTDSPFFDPDKKLYDVNYYRKMNPKKTEG